MGTARTQKVFSNPDPANMSDSVSVVSTEDSEVSKDNSSTSVEENETKTVNKTTVPGPINTTASEDSEYETLEEDNAGSRSSSQSSRSSRRSSFSDQHEDNASDDVAIGDEREDGDGQEENSLAKDKKLDDDEDRRNPQYIPKKGTFYEHDDRTMMDENEVEGTEVDPNKRELTEEGEKEQKAVTAKKGKVWTEKADRWTHDLYNEDDQGPKSTQELIDTYGYDIRNEEAPPKARRRRRYGRGPNKYTRNWEDEDAYTRSAPTQRRVYHNNREEFPDLGETGRGGNRRRDKGQGRSKSPKQPQLNETRPEDGGRGREGEKERERGPRGRERQREERTERGERDRGERLERVERVQPPAAKEQQPSPITQLAFERSTQSQSLPVTNSFPPPPTVIKDGESRVGRGRGFRGTGKPRPTMEFTASRGRVPLPAFSTKEQPILAPVQDSLKHAADMLIQDFSHVYISNNNNTNNIVEETIIPRSERRGQMHNGGGGGGGGGDSGEPSRSKRYSTQRQRSLPDSTPPPPPTTYSPPHNIPYYTQPPPNAGYVTAPVYNEVAAPSVTSPPLQMVAFLPPGPPPTAPAAPPYPPPPLLNYMPPPTFPPMALQPPLSGQFDDLAQAAGPELYQGQGGITYYSTQTQSVVHRPNPPRRVKLAIPIVPPPDQAPAGKQRQKQQQELQSAVS